MADRTFNNEVLPYLSDKQTLLNVLKEYNIERWDESNMVAFYDTDSKVGLFSKSDMICIYDENDKPVSITERLHRKNCKLMYWLKTGRMLRNKVKQMGFSMCVTFSHDYIDYTHFKQDWYTMIAEGQKQNEG